MVDNCCLSSPVVTKWKKSITNYLRFTYQMLLFMTFVRGTFTSEAAEELFFELTKGYHAQVRPVSSDNESVMVDFSLSISQLIDVDERSQIMTTSVWVRHKWKDVYLQWNPEDYNGINVIHIPAARIWRPDILLYNNADGNFDVQYLTNAIVDHNGSVTWFPPAIYKSACKINIAHFPFDEQNCTMKFGPWSHDSAKIDMESGNDFVDQEDYWPNGEWEIMESPAKAHHVAYPCCPNEFYADVTYTFILHRKPLFYVVTLVVPCLLISFLTILVFYLPSDAQEKITLSVSILLALIVFLLLIPNLIPPTSTTLPLIGKYMLFTMVLVTISITITVIVINIHFRSASTHAMPAWSRVVFLNYLPKLLFIKRRGQAKGKKKYRALKQINQPFSSLFTSISSVFKRQKQDQKPSTYVLESITPSLLEEIESRDREFDESASGKPLQKDCLEIIDNIEVIAKHMQADDEDEEVSDDWKFMAIVIDRLFLWIFTITCLSGTFGIILKAPMLWEPPGTHPEQNYTRPEMIENDTYEQLKQRGLLDNIFS